MNAQTERDHKIHDKVSAKLAAYPEICELYYQSLLASGKTFRTAQVYVYNLLSFIDYIFEPPIGEEFYDE